MKKVLFTFIAVSTLVAGCCNDSQMRPWRRGYLDIHQISTGRGVSAFMILPDGTTMLVDAGDVGDTSVIAQKRIAPLVPDSSKTAGEWIAQYINHFSKPLKKADHIDYALMSHFHCDHIGIPNPYSTVGNGYHLTGITYLGSVMNIDMLVDRGYPDYDFPSAEGILRQNGASISNYLNFVHERVFFSRGMEQFIPGVSDQFRLKYAPEKYPEFSINNVYVNGFLWNGKELVNLLPDEVIPNLDENTPSCVFHLEYGDFDYYSGGDASCSSRDWRNVAEKISAVVGECDVTLAPHHAYTHGINPQFVKNLHSQVYVIASWDYYHPMAKELHMMLDTTLYQGDRMVLATNMRDDHLRDDLFEDGDQFKPFGHVVVRVYPGGDEFQVFVLDEKDYHIIWKSEKMISAKD